MKYGLCAVSSIRKPHTLSAISYYDTFGPTDEVKISIKYDSLLSAAKQVPREDSLGALTEDLMTNACKALGSENAS